MALKKTPLAPLTAQKQTLVWFLVLLYLVAGVMVCSLDGSRHSRFVFMYVFVFVFMFLKVFVCIGPQKKSFIFGQAAVTGVMVGSLDGSAHSRFVFVFVLIVVFVRKKSFLFGWAAVAGVMVGSLDGSAHSRYVCVFTAVFVFVFVFVFVVLLSVVFFCIGPQKFSFIFGWAAVAGVMVGSLDGSAHSRLSTISSRQAYDGG